MYVSIINKIACFSSLNKHATINYFQLTLKILHVHLYNKQSVVGAR